jgi:hypothetical protein
LANQNIQAKLREGVDAARRGDKIAARRLLQQVLLSDKNNEIALMWMASVSDTVEDRRAYLRRALQINPNNERAREALSRLGEAPPAAAGSTGTRREAPSMSLPRPSRSGARSNYYLIAAGIVGAAVLLVALLAVINNLNRSNVQPTSDAAAQATFSALLNATRTQPPTPPPPTATALPGVVVTFNPDSLAAQLPPTFTPTPTYTPLPPTAIPPTPIPPSAYQIVFSDFDPFLSRGSLYIGDAGEARRIGQNEQAYDEVAYDPRSNRIAFVGPVYYEPEDDTPEVFAQEVFIASLDQPDTVTQVTRLRAVQAHLPQWSPDGSRILFGANPDGDQDLFLINADGSGILQLTDNNAIDTGGRFRFDGLIVYASDVESPGFTEIYTMNADGSSITRLTNHSGSSYSPAWSPDGQRIAYLNDSGGDSDVYIMDANGQRPFLLTTADDGAEDRIPTWSPDGLLILFMSNRGGEAFGWYATDLNGRVQSLERELENRVPQTLNFIGLKGE